ncbi:MAG: phospholipase D-like domain-containing protein [Tardiphaga sp.]
MTRMSPERIAEIADQYGSDVPGLSAELKAALEKTINESPETARLDMKLAMQAVEPLDLPPAPEEAAASERVIMASVGARPVARIFNNQATTEFLGPANAAWAKVISDAKPLIDKAIPAVGRIELNNSDYPWAGTGWLIQPGIIVTNRHVAELFAKVDRPTSRLVFRPGLSSGLVSADIDFLEEENRLDSAEHPITSILWMAPPDEADVAFLQVSRASGLALPPPIELAAGVEPGDTIVAIGYPARDPSIPDQETVIRIFGPDVYDKKRLSPGKVMTVKGDVIKHDCSTLGGNSGSLLLELKTGRAVGIHRAGLVDDSANLGVTASHLQELLLRMAKANVAAAEDPRGRPSAPTAQPEIATGSYRTKLYIPIEIIVNVGAPVQFTVPGQTVTHEPSASADAAIGSVEAAVEAATQRFAADPDVLGVRAGYRFKNGWITDERVVVIEVRKKLPFGQIQQAGAKALPREILGVGVDVRTAALPDQLQHLGVDLAVLERPGKAAAYKEPKGYDDESSEFFLGALKEKMDAIFHVSPDAGFANLKAFLERVETSLTATMYEWEPNHVSDAIEAAMEPAGRTLLMVTQKFGVGEKGGTEAAVQDMQQRIGGKFKHVWASVRGPNRLIPNSYHIKVASRDGAEVWLSSGNWKDSNQPKNPTKDTALKKFNREWHAIIKNERLATMFQKYIEFDFREAKRVPLEEREAVAIPDIEFFVPDDSLALSLERIPSATYQDELIITNEELEIQPLLTPDRDAQGRRMFMKFATRMIEHATNRILIQNQSFTLTEDNNEEFDNFFDVLKRKQKTIDDVRIIFRDARDYGRDEDLTKQQELIERLQDFGLDVSQNAVRLQSKCHTKGIIVDTKQVLLGSQNLTNQGSLFNRDASLLVRSPKVAAFYEKIFLYDWDNLAHNEADEHVGGIRRAQPGEPTPPGFQRLKLSELLADG